MKGEILTLNAGSSSIKWAVFCDGKKVDSGSLSVVGAKDAQLSSSAAHRTSFAQALEKLKACLIEKNVSPHGCGHRIVFGGKDFCSPTLLGTKELASLHKLIAFDPLHLMIELEVIQLSRTLFPDAVQVASFDTSFHHTIKKEVKLLPLPEKYRSQGIEKYGFHGLSYSYIAQQEEVKNIRCVACHLGSGSSLCALNKGVSVDTSMGFSPLGGIPMATRPGDLDPGVILRLLKEGETQESLEALLYYSSGLRAIAKEGADMKKLLTSDSPESLFAVQYYILHAAKEIASYIPVLEGIDALVFTGGIGEKAGAIREGIATHLRHFGFEIDTEKNASDARVISTQSSKKIYVIPTDEERVLADNVALYL